MPNELETARDVILAAYEMLVNHKPESGTKLHRTWDDFMSGTERLYPCETRKILKRTLPK